MAFISSIPFTAQQPTFSRDHICVENGLTNVDGVARRGRVTMAKPGPRRFVPGKGKVTDASKVKLEPETVYMEVRPAWTELIIPTLSIFTVIGLIPFVGSVCRQAWVRYKVTSRRISITSGFQGRDLTEVIYRDIAEIKFVRRLGNSGDMVLALKDGAKLELRTVPQMDEIYNYIMEQVDDQAREASGAA